MSRNPSIESQSAELLKIIENDRVNEFKQYLEQHPEQDQKTLLSQQAGKDPLIFYIALYKAKGILAFLFTKNLKLHCNFSSQTNSGNETVDVYFKRVHPEELRSTAFSWLETIKRSEHMHRTAGNNLTDLFKKVSVDSGGKEGDTIDHKAEHQNQSGLN